MTNPKYARMPPTCVVMVSNFRKRTLAFLGCVALIILFSACGGDGDSSQGPSSQDPLTVKLDEWREDCPPSEIEQGSVNAAGSPTEMYALKVQIETTSLWTSVEVSGLGSMTSRYSLVQGDEEINVQIAGLQVSELSRPEDGENVGKKIVLEIDAIAQKQGDEATFRISKENSGITTYTLAYKSGDTLKEIARFSNDMSESNSADNRENDKIFTLDLESLPSPISLSAEDRYRGPLFDAHAHLVGSRDIKHTRAEDDRLHINPETADEIFGILDDENIIGLIGFLPVIHEYFVAEDSLFSVDAAFNRTYQNETESVVNRSDNKITPFLHPYSHIGIPPTEHGHKLVDLIDQVIKDSEIPFRGIGEIHTSYPQTDSYYEMRLTDPVMLKLYDYAAANDLIIMIHPELAVLEDLHQALRHNPDTIFLLHGLIDSGGGGEPIAEHLAALFQEHQNAFFSVDAALMLGYSLMDACVYDKAQFMGNLRSEPLYHTLLHSSLAFWQPVIEAHPTRMMWGTDLYYWWHWEPDVISIIAQFGRDFISYLDDQAKERFAYRNAVEMLNMVSK